MLGEPNCIDTVYNIMMYVTEAESYYTAWYGVVVTYGSMGVTARSSRDREKIFPTRSSGVIVITRIRTVACMHTSVSRHELVSESGYF